MPRFAPRMYSTKVRPVRTIAKAASPRAHQTFPHRPRRIAAASAVREMLVLAFMTKERTPMTVGSPITQSVNTVPVLANTARATAAAGLRRSMSAAGTGSGGTGRVLFPRIAFRSRFPRENVRPQATRAIAAQAAHQPCDELDAAPRAM